jgi:predicted phosphodiesterase
MRAVGPVAVLSDIHGVLPALVAVLAEPDVRAADLIVVTGDIAAGPQPDEVLDLLLGLGPRALLVRGNADRELVELVDHGDSGDGDEPGGGGDPAVMNDGADPLSAWAAEQLRRRPDLVTVLRALPHPMTLDVRGFGPVLFCHGTPRADDEVVLVDSRPQRWTEVFGAVPDDVRTVVCGHTHMPFVRLADRRLVVNPGSVGMPYGGAGAHWAQLDDGAVTLRTTAFDVARARASIGAASGYPDVDAFTDEYLNSRASDFDALAAFGPRDGWVTETDA